MRIVTVHETRDYSLALVAGGPREYRITRKRYDTTATVSGPRADRIGAALMALDRVKDDTTYNVRFDGLCAAHA